MARYGDGLPVSRGEAMILKALFVLLLILIALGAVASQKPDSFKVERSGLVPAPPAAVYDERLYFHGVAAGADGRVAIALIDDRRQLGAALRYDPRQLPKLAQWKCLREAEYVLGIEPGNCHPTSRVEHRRLGELEHLQPGERKVVEIEFSVLEGAAEIQEFERASARPT